MTSFRGIQFEVAGTPHPVDREEVAKVEHQFACRFPDDYRSFVVEYGPGEFEPVHCKVLPPSLIAARTQQDRSRLREYWFWDESPEIWTQARAVESLACYDGDGHDIRFHPSDPSKTYFLSHDEQVIYQCEGLPSLLRLMCKIYGVESGALSFKPWAAEPGTSGNSRPPVLLMIL